MAIAESLASVIALIGQFRTERGDAAQAGFNEFMEWLAKTNHSELKDLLMLNAKATVGIKAILHQDREVMFEYLERIDAALAAFSTNFQGFGDLAAGIKPESILSEQALSILVQFERSKASKALELKMMGGAMYQFLDGVPPRRIEMTDERFVEDDFRTLVELGLLRHDFNGKGDNMYLITRAASSLVRSAGS